jgi:hypothetical protein
MSRLLIHAIIFNRPVDSPVSPCYTSYQVVDYE